MTSAPMKSTQINSIPASTSGCNFQNNFKIPISLFSVYLYVIILSVEVINLVIKSTMIFTFKLFNCKKIAPTLALSSHTI